MDGNCEFLCVCLYPSCAHNGMYPDEGKVGALQNLQTQIRPSQITEYMISQLASQLAIQLQSREIQLLQLAIASQLQWELRFGLFDKLWMIYRVMHDPPHQRHSKLSAVIISYLYWSDLQLSTCQLFSHQNLSKSKVSHYFCNNQLAGQLWNMYLMMI